MSLSNRPPVDRRMSFCARAQHQEERLESQAVRRTLKPPLMVCSRRCARTSASVQDVRRFSPSTSLRSFLVSGELPSFARSSAGSSPSESLFSYRSSLHTLDRGEVGGCWRSDGPISSIKGRGQAGRRRAWGKSELCTDASNRQRSTSGRKCLLVAGERKKRRRNRAAADGARCGRWEG